MNGTVYGCDFWTTICGGPGGKTAQKKLRGTFGGGVPWQGKVGMVQRVQYIRLAGAGGPAWE